MADSDFTTVRDEWNRLLGDHYFTPVSDPFAGIGSAFAAEIDTSLRLQIATHLEALDYLSLIEGGDLPPDSVWQPAFAAFRQDFAAAQSGPEPERVTLTLDGESLDHLDADERTIRQLKAVCTFEGEVRLGDWRHAAPTSLAARIAAHRLRAFGLLAYNQPLAARAEDRLQELTQQLAPPEADDSAGDLVDLLGDVPQLSSCFLLSQSRHAFAFAIDPAAATDLLNHYRINRPNTRGLRRLSFRDRKLGRARSTSAAAPTTFLPSGLREAKPESMPSAAVNQFALNLLQVRLWMFGYYAGALDGQWGRMIASALLRFLEEHESEVGESEALGERRAWLLGDSTRCVMDACHLFSYMVERLDDAAETTTRQEIDDILSQTMGDGVPGNPSPAAIATAEQAITSDLLAAHEDRRDRQQVDRAAVDVARIVHAPPPHRRRYFGWRSIFGFLGRILRWIGHTFQQAVHWLRRKIRQLAQYATSIVNYLRETTRRAVKLVSLGFQRLCLWISGTPIATVGDDGVALTRWSLDFDTLNVVLGRANPALTAAHIDRLNALYAGFGFLLEVAVGAWSIVCAFTIPIGNWLLAAWRVFKVVRRLLQKADDYAPLLARLEPAVV